MNNSKKKKRVSIDISADLYKQLQIEAVYRGIPVKYHIEDIVSKAAKKLLIKATGTYSNELSKI